MAVEGAVKALCNRLVLVEMSSRTSKDLAEQCIKVNRKRLTVLLGKNSNPFKIFTDRFDRLGLLRGVLRVYFRFLRIVKQA